jgi:hypothetical protein
MTRRGLFNWLIGSAVAAAGVSVTKQSVRRSGIHPVTDNAAIERLMRYLQELQLKQAEATFERLGRLASGRHIDPPIMEWPQ